MDGGIVLWSSLWEAVSRLMTGSSLDLVLGGAAASTYVSASVLHGLTRA